MASPSYPSSLWHSWEWDIGCLTAKLSFLLKWAQAAGSGDRLTWEGWYSQDGLHGGGRPGLALAGIYQAVYLPCGLFQLLLLRCGCLLPLGLCSSDSIPQRDGVAFPGTENLGNLLSQIPSSPWGLQVLSCWEDKELLLIGCALSWPCAHLSTGKVSEIQGTEAHGPTGRHDLHASPKLCRLNILCSGRFKNPSIHPSSQSFS